jgi:hypothetical protein
VTVMDMRPDVDLSLRIVRDFLGDVEAAWEGSNVELARGSLLSVEAECARLRAQLADFEAGCARGCGGARDGEEERRC